MPIETHLPAASCPRCGQTFRWGVSEPCPVAADGCPRCSPRLADAARREAALRIADAARALLGPALAG